jgi:hypothetical protein
MVVTGAVEVTVVMGATPARVSSKASSRASLTRATIATAQAHVLALVHLLVTAARFVSITKLLMLKVRLILLTSMQSPLLEQPVALIPAYHLAVIRLALVVRLVS